MIVRNSNTHKSWNKFTKRLFRLGSFTQANVGETEALLKGQACTLIKRRQHFSFFDSRLKILRRSFGVVVNQRNHSSRGGKPHRNIRAWVWQLRDQRFLLREN